MNGQSKISSCGVPASLPIKLQTIVHPQPSPFGLFDYHIGCAALGSCFATELTARMHDAGLTVSCNPNGIVYNLPALVVPLRRLYENRYYGPSDFFEFGGLWHSWEHHGKFSGTEPVAAAEHANEVLAKFGEGLRQARLLVITVSSAVVYRHLESGIIVANCHRVPGQQFERMLLSPEENFAALDEAVRLLSQLNPECKVVLTLSPVRHYPGELTLNSRSKGHLLTAIHACVEQHPKQCSYFPAFEIMNDELRDYRFYKDDMLHPAPLAVKIIMERFFSTFFSLCAVAAINARLHEAKVTTHLPRRVTEVDDENV